MGTYYSTSMGYGFGWPESEEAPKALLDLLDLPSHTDYVEEDALARLYPNLRIFCVGSYNHGTQYWTVVAKSTYKSVETHQIARYDLKSSPTSSELEELVRCHADLHLDHQAHPIGWWVGVDGD